ncbi:MAG: hypothetical protein WBE75_04730 [Candidatus Omnitrophota bacterium]
MKSQFLTALVAAAFLFAGCNVQQQQENKTAATSEGASGKSTVSEVQKEAASETLEVKSAADSGAASLENSLGEVKEAAQEVGSELESAAKEVEGALSSSSSQSDFQSNSIKEFVVYKDKNHKDNHYIPSGWMGDFGDVQMDEQSAENPHSGKHSIKFTYTAKQTQNQGWAGIYWQNPPNNWGSKKGGFNLTEMTKLTFWARGEKGGEVIQKFVIGGIKGTYPDSAAVEMGPVTLTNEWQEYSINLAGKDLSYINGGFGWTTSAELNPDGCVFYIDDISYAADETVQPEGKKVEEMPFIVYSDKGSVKNHFIPSGWMGDYGDIKYDSASSDNPHSGTSSLKITYANKASQGARWAGMYWQYPANNWGNMDTSFNLSKATKLTFWARGEKGGERVEEFKIGGITGEYPDSDSAGIGPVVLTTEWQQYTIDLQGKDLSSIIGGFCWSSNIDVNPDGIVFYMDDIQYE